MNVKAFADCSQNPDCYKSWFALVRVISWIVCYAGKIDRSTNSHEPTQNKTKKVPSKLEF